MNKIIIVALFGAAGAGKDAIQKEIYHWKPELFNSIISTTTRPKRDYEKDGIDYKFITDEQFVEYYNKGQFIELAEFRKWHYGTLKESLKLDKINIGVFNIFGVHQLLELPEEAYMVIPIQICCSDKERLLRQLNREEKPDCAEICRRFQTDKEDLSAVNLGFPHPYIFNEGHDVVYTAHETRQIIYEKILNNLLRGS